MAETQTRLTRFDLQTLQAFAGRRFRATQSRRVLNCCARLKRAGMIESDIVGGVVVWRTTEAGREATKGAKA